MRTGVADGKTNTVRGSWLTVYSLDSESGTPERDALDFAWSESSWQDNGVCITERRLPDKDVVGIRTGQVGRDGSPLWDAEHWGP